MSNSVDPDQDRGSVCQNVCSELGLFAKVITYQQTTKIAASKNELIAYLAALELENLGISRLSSLYLIIRIRSSSIQKRKSIYHMTSRLGVK